MVVRKTRTRGHPLTLDKLRTVLEKLMIKLQEVFPLEF